MAIMHNFDAVSHKFQLYTVFTLDKQDEKPNEQKSRFQKFCSEQISAAFPWTWGTSMQNY